MASGRDASAGGLNPQGSCDHRYLGSQASGTRWGQQDAHLPGAASLDLVGPKTGGELPCLDGTYLKSNLGGEAVSIGLLVAVGVNCQG